jgi:hypothetical protein
MLALDLRCIFSSEARNLNALFKAGKSCPLKRVAPCYSALKVISNSHVHPPMAVLVLWEFCCVWTTYTFGAPLLRLNQVPVVVG